MFPETTLVFDPPKESTSKNALLFAFKAGMEDFIENTSLRWFARVVDDEYVDIPNLAKLINEYESKFNPLKDTIIKGHLCNYFLHGGSGWLLSRKTVQRLLKVWNSIKIDYSKSDDHFAMNYFLKLGVIPKYMSSSSFLGSYMETNPYDLMLNKWANITKCPKNTTTIKMSDVAFWHSSQKDLGVLTHGYELLRTMPDFVYGEFSSGPVNFCKYDCKL